MFSSPDCPMSVQIQLLTEWFLPPPSPCWALGEAAKVIPAHNAEILSSVQSETYWDGGETCPGSTTPGDMPSSRAWGQVFGVVQSSVEADVVLPQLGEPAMVGDKAEERPEYWSSLVSYFRSSPLPQTAL